MTIEDKLKAIIGDLIFQIAALQVENETLKQQQAAPGPVAVRLPRVPEAAS